MNTRVLVIGQVWPEPRSSAAGSHMMQIIQCFLQQGWQITFACAAVPGEQRADLAALGIRECAITLNCDSFDVFVSNLDPHIVLFDRFMSEEQYGWRLAQHCPQALRVLETSDLHCLRAARQHALQQHLKNGGDGDDLRALLSLSQAALYARMATDDIALREIAAIYRCDISLMISRVEIELLTKQFHVPASLLLHCPLMADAVPDSASDFFAREHFVTIGNFHHAPNRDAVQWLKQSLWPKIRTQLPQAQLHVYGAYTPQHARQMHKPQQGFHIMGWAEDAMQVMRRARVCLAPLRFGAGIKGKLFDAMLCGTPSVTTPIGAEAMHDDNTPWCGAIASTADNFSHHAVNLYRNEQVWQQAQQQGFAILAAHFEREPVARALIVRINSCRQQLTEERQQNFTGSLLRHHQHKSTEYLSRWISEKNRNSAASASESTPH